MDPTNWIAILEDGTEITQVSLNPHDSRDAWNKFKDCISRTQTKIKQFGLKFRTHAEFLPDRQVAYYFSHGLRATLAGQKTQKDYYVLGWVDESLILHKRWYMVPELIVEDTSEQPVSFPLADTIIWNG